MKTEMELRDELARLREVSIRLEAEYERFFNWGMAKAPDGTLNVNTLKFAARDQYWDDLRYMLAECHKVRDLERALMWVLDDIAPVLSLVEDRLEVIPIEAFRSAA